jgi:hypothetical protein
MGAMAWVASVTVRAGMAITTVTLRS